MTLHFITFTTRNTIVYMLYGYLGQHLEFDCKYIYIYDKSIKKWSSIKLFKYLLWVARRKFFFLCCSRRRFAQVDIIGSLFCSSASFNFALVLAMSALITSNSVNGAVDSILTKSNEKLKIRLSRSTICRK
jgi:hypothetical protein